MRELAKTHLDQLDRIKKNVEGFYDYFKKNYDRYTRFRNFVFVSSMSEGARSVNNELDRNSLEFNVTEAYLSRLIGEFAKNEPGVMVSLSDDFMPRNQQEEEMEVKRIGVIEGHLRHIFHEAKKKGTQPEIYKELLSGGYSSAKVGTRYINSRSFTQEIFFEKTYDQTLIGFDPMASEPDKSDGNFCYEIIPMRVADFEKEFSDVDITKIRYHGDITADNSGKIHNKFGKFTWAFEDSKEKIILVADYYEKKKKKTQLLKLSNGETMLKEEYDKYLAEWQLLGIIELPPIEVARRETEITKIVRYQLIQNKVLSHEETDLPSLPIKFFDGNSIFSRDGDAQGSAHQMTRPYFYQAEGAQRLKNFAGQCLANELENMRPTQIIASIESIPEQYLEAYRKPQNTTVLAYNAFLNGNPNNPLNPPMIAPRQPIPAEIPNTFMQADVIMQNVLGSFDASLTKLTEQQISGKAMREAITLSNAGAKPFVDHYFLGLESIAQLIVDIMPIYYKDTKRIPIRSEEGDSDTVDINGDNGITFDYEPGAYNVKVEAGVSFDIQRTEALNQLMSLSHAMPKVGEFLNEAGMDIVMDNVEIRGADKLRLRSKQWMQQEAQAKQQAMQAAMSQPKIEQQALQVAAQQVQSEAQIGMAKVQQQAIADQSKTALKVAELELDREKMRIELEKIKADLMIAGARLEIDQQKANDERITTVIDAAVKQSEHAHDITHKHFERNLAALESDREHERAEKEAKQAMNKIVAGE